MKKYEMIRNISVHQGVATLPDGSTVNLAKLLLTMNEAFQETGEACYMQAADAVTQITGLELGPHSDIFAVEDSQSDSLPITDLILPPEAEEGPGAPTAREVSRLQRLVRKVQALKGFEFLDEYPREDWMYEVSNGDTVSGYASWALSKIEQDLHDLGAPVTPATDHTDSVLVARQQAYWNSKP